VANWTPEPQPFGANRAPLIAGVSENDGVTPVPIAVDPATGRMLVNATGGSAATSVAINDGVTTSRKATVATLTDSNPLAAMIVDGNGDQITSFGGGTQYTDAAAAPAHPVGPTLEWNNGGTWATASAATPLPVTANAGTNLNTSLLATSANLTAGTQKTQIVDGSGNVIASTSNALNVNISSSGLSNQSINLAQVNGHTTVEGGVNGTQAVGGNQATNNNVSTNANPLLIAGSDYGGTPKIQSAKVDSVGKQYIATVDTVTGITNALPTGTNVIGHVITDTTSTTAVTQTTSPWVVGTAGASLRDNIVSIGDNDVATSAPGTQLVSLAGPTGDLIDSTGSAVNVAVKNPVPLSPSITGLNVYYQLTLNNTPLAIKVGAGAVYGYHIYNPNTTAIWVSFFNSLASSIGGTPLNTTPSFVLIIPPSGIIDSGPFPFGLAFSQFITIAASITNSVSGLSALTSAALANVWYV